MQNTPENYGFLDVSYFNGDGFAPASGGVIRQRFTAWSNGREYTRCFFNNAWTPWVGDSWNLFNPGEIIVNATPKNITISDAVKKSKEIIVIFGVVGAPDLCRSIMLIPGYLLNNGSYLRRSDNQEASVFATYNNGTITVGTYILTGLTVNVGGILYR